MAMRDLVHWKQKDKNLPAKHEEEADPFAALQRRMNRLFEEFSQGFGGFGLAPFSGMSGMEWAPQINLSENDKELMITAELPGMDEKDIDIELTKDSLTIKGEKKAEKEEKEANFYRMERSFGSFSRTLPLPSDIESDKVDASFKNGVLKITMPKTKEAQTEAKKIPIKS